MRSNYAFFYALLFISFSSFAQTPLTTEFLADSTSPTDEALQAHVSGKTFKVKTAKGDSWRLEYKANGYAYLNAGGGYSDSGKWRVEKGQLCNDWTKLSSNTCSDVKMKDALLYFTRVVNGEILTFQSE